MIKLAQEDVNNFICELIEIISENVHSKDVRKNIYLDMINAAENSDIILNEDILSKSDTIFDDVYSDTHGG